MKQRRCKCGCGQVVKGHPNKKFFNKKHKDEYWNRVNPRGIALRPARIGRWEDGSEDDFERIGEKIDPIEDSMHPGDPSCFGKD